MSNEEKANGEKANGEKVNDPDWIDWFHSAKRENPKGILIMLSQLNDFVEKNPDDAAVMTVEAFHRVLMVGISFGN